MAVSCLRSLLVTQAVLQLLLLASQSPVRAGTLESITSGQISRLPMPTVVKNTEGVKHMRELLQSDADQKLFDAANDGDIDAVKEALDDGANVNVVRGEFDDTPLTSAVLNGFLEIVELLLDNDADTSVVDATGFTALVLAIDSNLVDIVEALLDAGADVEQTGGSGTPPLVRAASQGFGDIVVALLKAGADANSMDANGDSAIHWISATIGEASEDALTALLDGGADANKQGDGGWTPLMWASSFGNTANVEILLDKNVDKSVEGDNGTADDLVCSCLDVGEGFVGCDVGACDEDSIKEIRDLLADD